MAQLRHYNGSFGPRCPEGWRRVEVGESHREWDLFWHNGCWLPSSRRGCVTPDGFLRIRRIATDGSPSTCCTECDRLRAELSARDAELERITMRLWNYFADTPNQWGALGQGQRETIMLVAWGEIGPDGGDS